MSGWIYAYSHCPTATSKFIYFFFVSDYDYILHCIISMRNHLSTLVLGTDMQKNLELIYDKRKLQGGRLPPNTRACFTVSATISH